MKEKERAKQKEQATRKVNCEDALVFCCLCSFIKCQNSRAIGTRSKHMGKTGKD